MLVLVLPYRIARITPLPKHRVPFLSTPCSTSIVVRRFFSSPALMKVANESKNVARISTL